MLSYCFSAALNNGRFTDNGRDMVSSRNYFFDILRILSVLLVITSHYSYMFDTSPLLTFPRDYLTGGIGRLGVSFFFMISGALSYLALSKYDIREFYRRRIFSVLVPYNIVYFFMGFLLLLLGGIFLYPDNPLTDIYNGNRSFLSILPSILGFDHYLHGVYEINTAYLTGEWFIGCIILLYAFSPFIFQAIVRYPIWTMLAALALSLATYDKNITNPYWSAQVRVSDFTFGMLLIHYKAWFTRYRYPMAAAGLILILAGTIWAGMHQLPVREVLFPLHPVAILFAVAFLTILLAVYPFIHPLFNHGHTRAIMMSLASRAYIIMLLQHVVIIFISTNIDMSSLNSAEAVMWYGVALLGSERLSSLIKPLAVRCEQMLLGRRCLQ